MKVLMMQIDVSNLSEEEQESLVAQLSFTIPEEAELLATKIANVDEETGEYTTDEDDEDPTTH